MSANSAPKLQKVVRVFLTAQLRRKRNSITHHRAEWPPSDSRRWRWFIPCLGTLCSIWHIWSCSSNWPPWALGTFFLLSSELARHLVWRSRISGLALAGGLFHIKTINSTAPESAAEISLASRDLHMNYPRIYFFAPLYALCDCVAPSSDVPTATVAEVNALKNNLCFWVRSTAPLQKCAVGYVYRSSDYLRCVTFPALRVGFPCLQRKQNRPRGDFWLTQ